MQAEETPTPEAEPDKGEGSDTNDDGDSTEVLVVEDATNASSEQPTRDNGDQSSTSRKRKEMESSDSFRESAVCIRIPRNNTPSPPYTPFPRLTIPAHMKSQLPPFNKRSRQIPSSDNFGLKLARLVQEELGKEIKNQKTGLESELDNVKGKLSAIKLVLKQKTSEIRKLQEQLFNTRAQNSIFRMTQKRLTEINENLRVENAKLKKENDEIKRQVSTGIKQKLNSMKARLGNDIETLREAERILSAYAHRQTQKTQDLRNEIDRLVNCADLVVNAANDVEATDTVERPCTQPTSTDGYDGDEDEETLTEGEQSTPTEEEEKEEELTTKFIDLVEASLSSELEEENDKKREEDDVSEPMNTDGSTNTVFFEEAERSPIIHSNPEEEHVRTEVEVEVASEERDEEEGNGDDANNTIDEQDVIETVVSLNRSDPSRSSTEAANKTDDGDNILYVRIDGEKFSYNDMYDDIGRIRWACKLWDAQEICKVFRSLDLKHHFKSKIVRTSAVDQAIRKHELTGAARIKVWLAILENTDSIPSDRVDKSELIPTHLEREKERKKPPAVFEESSEDCEWWYDV